jgi:hypothetical protein
VTARSGQRYFTDFTDLHLLFVFSEPLNLLPNGGVDAAARINAPFAAPSKLRNTLPPLASNDLLDSALGAKDTLRQTVEIEFRTMR